MTNSTTTTSGKNRGKGKGTTNTTPADVTTPQNVHQLNGGKGLSRREICQRAVDKLRVELEAAEARLFTAIMAEQEGAKPKSKEAKAWAKAAKVLRNLGWDEDRITTELGPKPE